MPEERLDLVQIQLISAINKAISPLWMSTHEISSGKLVISIYGQKGFMGSPRPYIGKITFDQEKKCLLLHFRDDVSATEKGILEDYLKIASNLPVYQI